MAFEQHKGLKVNGCHVAQDMKNWLGHINVWPVALFGLQFASTGKGSYLDFGCRAETE